MAALLLLPILRFHFLSDHVNLPAETMLGQFETDVKVLAKIPLSKGITDQLHDNKLIESIRLV